MSNTTVADATGVIAIGVGIVALLVLVSCISGVIVWACWDVAVLIFPSLPVLTLWQSVKLTFLTNSLVRLNNSTTKSS